MDEALQLTTQVREGFESSPDVPWPYRFFGAALVGRTPTEELPLGVRVVLTWASTEARRAVVSGRSGPDQEMMLGLRLAYQALKAEAASVRPQPQASAGGASREPVTSLVRRIRHRQRAALLLRYGVGMSEADVARILGVRTGQVQAIMACAVSAVAAKAGRPVDVPRALRRAGRHEPKPRVARETVRNVERLPRGVTRRLIAPVPGVGAQPAEGKTPVEVLIGSAASAQHRRRPAIVPSHPSGNGRRRGVWSLLGRVAAAASVGLLFAWSIWPVHV